MSTIRFTRLQLATCYVLMTAICTAIQVPGLCEETTVSPIQQARSILGGARLGVDLWGESMADARALNDKINKMEERMDSAGEVSGSEARAFVDEASALEKAAIVDAVRGDRIYPHPLAPSRDVGKAMARYFPWVEKYRDPYVRNLRLLFWETEEMFKDWDRAVETLARFGIVVDVSHERAMIRKMNDEKMNPSERVAKSSSLEGLLGDGTDTADDITELLEETDAGKEKRERQLSENSDFMWERIWMGYKLIGRERIRAGADLLMMEKESAILKSCIRKRRELGADMDGIQEREKECEKTLREFRTSFSGGNWAAIVEKWRLARKAMDAARRTAFNTVDQAPVVYPGASLYSTGRFAMGAHDGALTSFEVAEGCIWRPLEKGSYYCNSKNRWSLCFRPPEAELQESSVLDASWTHARRSYQYIANGNQIEQIVTWALGAPSVRIDNKADRFVLRQIREGVSSGPSRIGCMIDGKPVLFDGKNEIDASKLSEGWLLLLWEDGDPQIPVIVVLEHSPDSIERMNNGMILSRRANVGKVSVATLDGAVMWPAMTSAEWKTIPGDVLERIRRLVPLMLYTPLEIEEIYAIENRTITIWDRVVSYENIQDDWQTPHGSYVPFPPLYAFAVDQGLRVRPRQELSDNICLTKYGPFRVAKGDELAYTIPEARMWDQHVLASDDDVDIQNAIRGALREYHPWMMGRQAPSWFIYDVGQRKGILRPMDESELRAIFNREKQADGFETSLDFDLIVDSSTGKSYWGFGWRGTWNHGVRVRGDITSRTGHPFVAPYTYAKCFGRWDLVRDCWQGMIRTHSAVLGRQDWAGPGHDCQGSGYIFSLDMLNDGNRSSCCLKYLAHVLGKKEEEANAAYVGSRTAISVTASQLPEAVDYEAAVSPLVRNPERPLVCEGLTDTGFLMVPATSTIYPLLLEGTSYNGLYSFYDMIFQTAPRALLSVYHRLRSSNSEWSEEGLKVPLVIRMRKHDNNHAKWNQALAIYKLSAWCAHESPERLHEYAVSMGLLDNPDTCPLPDVYSPALATTVGRKQPLWLAGWDMAVLESAFYSHGERAATIILDAPRQGELSMVSLVAPDTVRVNGVELTADKYRYDEKRRELYVPFEKGEQIVKMHFGKWDWRNPEYPVFGKAPGLVSYPPLKIKKMSTKKTQEAEAADNRGDYVVGATDFVDLEKFCNTGLKNVLMSDDENVEWGWPQGKVWLRGVPFQVVDPAANDGRNCIALGRIGEKSFPKDVSGMPVDKNAKRLFFLHAVVVDPTLRATGGLAEETVLWNYVLHFADDQMAFVPVRYGSEVDICELYKATWTGDEALKDIPGALGTKVFGKVDTGSGEGDNKDIRRIGLYVSEWENTVKEEAFTGAADFQLGLAKVANMDIVVSRGNWTAMILAITAEVEK